jgi:hypothetical protein
VALTLDSQINYHLNAAQLYLALGVSIAIASTAIGLRYLLRYAHLKSSGTRSARYSLLAFGILMAITVKTDGARFFQLLGSTISPEFAFVVEMSKLGQEYLSSTPSISFAPNHSLDRWNDQCVKAPQNCPDIVVVAVEALRHDVLAPKNNPELIAPNL